MKKYILPVFIFAILAVILASGQIYESQPANETDATIPLVETAPNETGVDQMATPDETIDETMPEPVAETTDTTPNETEGTTAAVEATTVDETTIKNVSTIRIMEHLCPANITSRQELLGIGGPFEMEVACPIVVREGDIADTTNATVTTGNTTISSVTTQRVAFDYSVMADNESNISSKTLDDAEFVSERMCEEDVNFDLNSDGNITDNYFLYSNHYLF